MKGVGYVLVLLAIVTASPAAQQTNTPTTGHAAISGVVIDATTGKPVAGASVALSRTDALTGLAPRMVTDARGRFVFRNLPAATTYFLDARRFGYASTRWGWTGPGQSSAIKDIAQISLTDDQWVSNISIPLWKYGAMSGRVLDERGEPVVGVAVRAFSTMKVAGQPQLVGGSIATTDDRGVYRITGVQPGRYVLSVLSVQSTVLSSTPEAPASRAVGELDGTTVMGGSGTSTVTGPGIDQDGAHRLVISNFATPPPPGAERPRTYPAIFYPGTRSAADAQAIEIGYGDSRTSLDFQLVPVAGARVSGRLETGGVTLPPFLLRLMPVGSERLGFGSEAATTLVEGDGSFTFLNVPDGDYTLLAQSGVMDFASGTVNSRMLDAPGFPRASAGVGSLSGVPGLEFLTREGPASPLSGRVAVSVAGRDRNDVVVPMRPTVKVTGKIVYAEGARPPAASNQLFMTVEPADGDPALGRIFSVSPPSSPQTFTIEGLRSGVYLLASFQSTLVSMMWEGHDITYTGFDATLGRDIDDVVITLTDKVTAIAGTVRDGQGPAGATVLAFPVNPERWVNFGWSPRLLRSARAASNGTFKLPSLTEGDYFLIAVPANQADGWMDPKFLAAAAPLATRVSIKWGDSRTQDLTIAEVTIK